MQKKVLLCSLIVCCSLTLCIAAPTAPAAPQWPPYYRTDWTMYNVRNKSPSPPYSTLPPLPYEASSGTTYYDSTANPRAMLEVYNSYCVPIFPNESGSRWRCHFLNVGGVSYLITFDDHPDAATRPPCCVFGDPWYPPTPDFLQRLQANDLMPWAGQFDVVSRDVDVWVAPHGDGAPFGYGFYSATLTNETFPQAYGVPAMFYFVGVNPNLVTVDGRRVNVPTEGWATQRFANFEPVKPPSSVWQVPDSCKTATWCPISPQRNSTATAAAAARHASMMARLSLSH
jgi:hypothetical protein